MNKMEKNFTHVHECNTGTRRELKWNATAKLKLFPFCKTNCILERSIQCKSTAMIWLSKSVTKKFLNLKSRNSFLANTTYCSNIHRVLLVNWRTWLNWNSWPSKFSFREKSKQMYKTPPTLKKTKRPKNTKAFDCTAVAAWHQMQPRTLTAPLNATTHYVSLSYREAIHATHKQGMETKISWPHTDSWLQILVPRIEPYIQLQNITNTKPAIWCQCTSILFVRKCFLFWQVMMSSSVRLIASQKLFESKYTSSKIDHDAPRTMETKLEVFQPESTYISTTWYLQMCTWRKASWD